MKTVCTFLLIIISLVGYAQKNIQIFDVTATNSKLINDSWVFENDTVKITYSFWDNKGVLSFTVFNKLNRPIYIDWKNSAFIYNDNKLNYWNDETKLNASVYGNYFHYGNFGFSTQDASSTSIKLERVTFIPPKSNYIRDQFNLYPNGLFKFGTTSKALNVPRNDNPRKVTTVISEEFDLNNSPLRFRSYLSFSFAENLQQYFFIDNGFYISSAQSMDFRHYNGKYLKYNFHQEAINKKSDYKKPSAFYIF